MGTREEVFYNIFLDLRKSYKELDRECCLEILVVCGIGPRIDRVLRFYWEHLFIVYQAGRYYGTTFKGHWGVTHGDTL